MADERLICQHCGESGKVVVGDGGYRVEARCGGCDNGKCQTARHPSEEAAIAAWEKMWEHENV